MNSQIANLVIVLVVMQFARRLNFEDENTVMYARISYVVSQVSIMLMYYYISVKIRQKNDTTTLKYVEPKQAMSNEPAQLVTTTNRDYDLAETSKATKQVLMGIAIMGVFHFYFKFTQPLVLQSILPLKNAFEAKVAQIHLFNKSATGDLKRPFKTAGPFGMSSEQPASDKASLAAAEKAEKQGKKDD